jgi:hypothetical protein
MSLILDELDFGWLDDEGPECYLLEAESRQENG